MTDNRTTERVDHPPRVREAIDELMREKDANDNRTTELLREAEREIVILRDKLRIANATGVKTCMRCGTFLSDELLCTECAATLGNGTLTAEQVREAIERHSVWVIGNNRCFHDGAYEEIADELNATLGSGECEIETTESRLPAERYHRCKNCGAFFAVMNASEDIPPYVCPNCGKAVKR